MLPKFNRQHIVWIAAIIITLFYIVGPDLALTHILRQIFHAVLSFLLTILG